MSAHRRGVGVHFRPEVTETNQRLGGRGILERDASFRTFSRTEEFVFREFVEADELRAVERLVVDEARALDADEAVGAVVLDGAFGTRGHGEFLGREVLEFVDLAVDDPLVFVAIVFLGGDRFEVVVVLEVRIHVLVPVELIDDEVDVLVLGLGHILDEQGPGYFASFNEVLIHTKHVRTPLWLIGAERTGGMQDARVDQPTGTGLELIGLGKLEDLVVTLVPVGDALTHLCLGRARLKTHESVGEIIPDVIVLRGEVIRFRFTFEPEQLRLFGVLVHVVRDRTHVVEKLGVDGPLLIFLPDGGANKFGAEFGDGLLQREAHVVDDDVRETFVRRPIIVRCFGGRSEPALVDAAAVKTECIEIIRVKLETFPGLQERAWHPARGEAQEAARVGELFAHHGGNARFLGG